MLARLVRFADIDDQVRACATVTDDALFTVSALTDDTLVHEAPAIVSRLSESARAGHAVT